MDRVKRIWYLSHIRAAKVQASLRIRAVPPESPLLAHISSESRGTIRQKATSLASLNGWECAVKICHDGMLEDTNSLDGAQMAFLILLKDIAHSNLAPYFYYLGFYLFIYNSLIYFFIIACFFFNDICLFYFFVILFINIFNIFMQIKFAYDTFS